MSDAELATLEARMIAAVLEATADVVDDAGELPDGNTDARQDGDGCVDGHADDEHADGEAANPQSPWRQG